MGRERDGDGGMEREGGRGMDRVREGLRERGMERDGGMERGMERVRERRIERERDANSILDFTPLSPADVISPVLSRLSSLWKSVFKHELDPVIE